MRILCFGGITFSAALRELGNDVYEIVMPGKARSQKDIEYDFFKDPSRAADFFRSVVESIKPDLLFQGDSSAPLIHLRLEQFDTPKAWYAIDTHLHSHWHKHYATQFDQVFVAQQNLVNLISACQPCAEWLPLFCGCKAPFLPWDTRIWPISFVGTLDKQRNPERLEVLDALAGRGINVHAAAGEYLPVYSASKAVFNLSVNDDLNMRFFEGPGCGALLITDRLSHSMQSVLEPGVDYLVYTRGDLDQIVAAVDWVLTHHKEAQDMARRAHEKIAAGHLARNRAVTLQERFEKMIRGEGTLPSNRSVREGHLAWALKQCSWLKLPERITDVYKRYAWEYGRGSENCPWGAIVLALKAFEEERFIAAVEEFEKISPVPEDAEFLFQYYSVAPLAKYHCGFHDAARRCAQAACLRFPDNPDIKKIYQLLCKT